MNAPVFSPKHIQRTDEQTAIQTASAKFIIIEANAGAAKTTTLALRIAESLDHGTPPEKILALTYTEPACEAMRAALRKIGVRHELARRVRIGTFEAFARAVLRRLEGSVPPATRPSSRMPCAPCTPWRATPKNAGRRNSSSRGPATHW